MRRKWILSLVSLAVLTGSLLADVSIPPAAVVHNPDGVCWWAAAETIGKAYSLPALDGLTDRVRADKTGYRPGATPATIAYWAKKAGFVVEANAHGNADAGIVWVSARLAAGVPVIACFKTKAGDAVSHAVVLTRIDWAAGTVHYVDSNYPGEVRTIPYAVWRANWIGRAYAIDPAAQTPPAPDAVAVAEAEAARGRAILAGKPKINPLLAGKSPPVASPVLPPNPLLARPSAPAAPAPRPKNPVVPVVLVPGSSVKVPSNQDIKDGVRRPDDRLRYGIYAVDGGRPAAIP